MAEKSHSSSSIMYVVIAIALLLVVALVPLSRMGKGSAPAGGASDEADNRIQPVARVELVKAAPAASGKPRDGATVYGAVCAACHGSGVAGAPKAGDKAAWAPRIATGMPALIKSATKGKGAMPPKGGAADLSDAELKAAVEHLVGLAK
jgi:cytochrome c5